jgi:quinone-modifying oxidoreductase subunit QmoC
MAWAAWGMKNRLLEDLDVWLCHQCDDCSIRCPRGVRPGDVMAAIRMMCVRDYSFPRFFGRWANQPQSILLLLGLPTLLLTLALVLRDPLGNALGFSGGMGDRIVYAYSTLLPHWLLNSFFGLFTILVLVVVATGTGRFWRVMNAANRSSATRPVKGLVQSIAAAVKSIILHDKFAMCDEARPRMWSHSFVFFGFAALTVVTIWVITAPHNPLIKSEFVYPFGFWSPWKLLANAGGAALLIGLFLMARDRLREKASQAVSSYTDWALIASLAAVVLSGFVTEVLHYVRLEPHRQIAYFVHLITVFALLIYLPYTKLAHLVYRTAAIAHAEYFGRRIGEAPSISTGVRSTEKEKEAHDSAAAG